MSYILILVASCKGASLQREHLQKLSDYAGSTNSWHWLEGEKAAELRLDSLPIKWSPEIVEGMLAGDRIDFFLTPDDGARRKKLLISDMDNTMVVGETLDDLAETCGLKAEIAAITEKAMAGELDFAGALRTRVMMLRGLETSALTKTAKKIEYMPGGETLVRVMRENGAYCVLVSGGFTCFTGHVAEKLGFHAHHGNVLEIEDEKLTGEVVPPLLDHRTKLTFLQEYSREQKLEANEILAVGDGANDLSMIAAAGLGVGFHPKPYLKKHAKNSIIHGDLTALLYVQGYTGF